MSELRAQRRSVVQRAREATVGFGIIFPEEQQRPPSIMGSGVAVAAGGVILTARHVVLDVEAEVMKARRVGRPADAVVIILASAQFHILEGQNGEESRQLNLEYTVGRMETSWVSPEHDIAVVKTAGEALPRRRMPLNGGLAPWEGDPVATCGWPYGTQLHPGGMPLSSFLLGSVSAVVPHPEMEARSRLHYLMQLPVNPGNSGGGAFDPDTGEVFGVVSSRLAPGGIPTGLSIIIPAYHAEPVVADMADTPATE